MKTIYDTLEALYVSPHSYKLFIKFNFYRFCRHFNIKKYQKYFSLVFCLFNICTFDVFLKAYSNLARKFEISGNKRNKLHESWTRPTFLQLNGWKMKNVKSFKIHYPTFTFPFNWIHLNGWCILRFKLKSNVGYLLGCLS